MSKTITYKDNRDDTVVYSGVTTIGKIVRAEGGWTWLPKGAEKVDDAMPRFSSRQRAKEGLTFRNFTREERESEEYETLHNRDRRLEAESDGGKE